MGSLATRLTLSFVTVGIIGAILVALLTGLRTRVEFSRFVGNRDLEALSDALSAYYLVKGDWEGVERFVQSDRRLHTWGNRVVVVDEQNNIAYGPGPRVGPAAYEADTLARGVAIEVNGERVGVALLEEERFAGNRPGLPLNGESAFLSGVTWAAIVSAGIAGLLALALGLWLTRTLTRPIHALTEAAQAMAGGQLGLQVDVPNDDELGRLAASFNQMSHDLAHASQVQKQMTADIAHDLRTPLSILRGYAEALQDQTLAGSPELYGIMVDEVMHLERLVNDLRTLSLAETGGLALNLRAVDPKALLERAGLKYVLAAEQQGIALRLEAADDLPSIMVDVDRMTQVLNNLVANALRHTTAGEIVLTAAQEGNEVVMAVRDTGAGIAPEDTPYIFERFYRVDKSRQRAGQSPASGLGLAIVKALVEAHKGSIQVTSTPQHGSTFTLRLPALATS